MKVPQCIGPLVQFTAVHTIGIIATLSQNTNFYSEEDREVRQISGIHLIMEYVAIYPLL